MTEFSIKVSSGAKCYFCGRGKKDIEDIFGKMTKEISKLQNQLKIYTGTFILGSSTPSFDLESPIDNFYKIDHIDKHLINEVLPNFI